MKSLDKKKTKKLDFNDKLYDIWFESLCNGNYQMFQKKIKEMFTQQRTELEQQKVKVVWNDVCEQIKKDTIEQILNLECLKEEKYESVFHKGVRNQLRKEIKEEIKKL